MRRLIALLALLLVAGCWRYFVFTSSADDAGSGQAVDGVSDIQTQIVADGLSRPWGMAFLPDGSVLVTERVGSLRRIINGQVSAPFSGLPEIAVVGQGGLLDIALDPDFPDNQRIYLSYSERSAAGPGFGTAVGRARIDLKNRSLTEFERVFSTKIKSGGGRHFGSRLRFAQDKSLFVTHGDRGDQPRAQNPFDHAGSIIRINRDGSVPADNPFADGEQALAEIYSIGHRNPQGLAIDSHSATLWSLSHGARGGDEVNRVVGGRNYG